MRSWFRVVPLLCLIALFAFGCGESEDAPTPKTTAETTAKEPTLSASPEEIEHPSMKGPNGETAVGPRAVDLTEEQVAELKAGDHTVAFVWHALGLDLNAIELGARKRLKELGIEVVAATNANFDAAKQQNDLETVEALKPDVIVSLPVDSTSSAKMYRHAADKGSRLVFLSNIPAGFRHGEDYVGVVTTNVVQAAVESAHLLGRHLGGEGKVGVLYYDADFFIVNQWDEKFEEVLQESYPGIEIAARMGFADPARANEPASAMLTRYPDLDAVYVSWNDPAHGVLTALRAAGRDDVAVTDVGMDEVTALDLAKGGPFIGAGVDAPQEAGRALANEIGYAILGERAPPFVVSGFSLMTRGNLAESWPAIYGQPTPEPVLDALGQ